MKKNIGSVDRIIRIVVGVIILTYGYQTKNWLGLLGLVPIVTAAIRFCPLYSLVGCKSCSASS